MAFMTPAVARVYAMALRPCPVLALDIGKTFVGLAGTRDVHTVGPEPLKSYIHLFSLDPEHFPVRLSNLIRAHKAELIVVGWPQAEPGEKDLRPFVFKFVDNLQKHQIAVPIVQIDERFSTVEAHETLFKLQSEAGKNLHEDKSLLDQTAACVILARFMSSLKSTQ